MPSVAEQLVEAKRLQAAGNLRGAEQAYLQVTLDDANHAEAHYLLGTVRQALGKTDEAIESLRHAARLQSQHPAIHQQLGMLLAHEGRLEDAAACYRRAIDLSPGYVAAHGNLGNLLRQQGDLQDAARCFDRVLQLNPRSAEAHNDLGILYQKLGRFDEAVDHYRRALELRPDFAQAHHNLGDLLSGQNEFEEAAACFRRALELRPDLAESHNGLGLALQGSRQLPEAEVCFERAVALKSDYLDARNNLGVLLMEMKRIDEARQCFLQLIQAHPDYASAYNNLANLHMGRNQLPAALECYGKAIALDPADASAHCNHAYALLRAGQFEQGWQEYLWLWHDNQHPSGAGTRWKGGPLDGKTILLWSDRGLGDVLQFVRYAELVKQRGAKRVIVECPSVLVGLVRLFGVDHVISNGDESVAFDVHLPIAALPAVFQTPLDAIPSRAAYLSPRVELREPWKSALASDEKFKIGIAWQGNPAYGNDPARSIPLAAFAGLPRRPSSVYSLQTGYGREQLATLDASSRIVDLGEPGDFEHTARIMQQLDLLITSDSSHAHLAGALGVPVWVALSYVADWRWLLDREDSPWYPTMRLFRQQQPGDWDDVFRRIAAALDEYLRNHERSTHER